jgi:hypothetical protein
MIFIMNSKIIRFVTVTDSDSNSFASNVLAAIQKLQDENEVVDIEIKYTTCVKGILFYQSAMIIARIPV